jgi:hypothetical protein
VLKTAVDDGGPRSRELDNVDPENLRQSTTDLGLG